VLWAVLDAVNVQRERRAALEHVRNVSPSAQRDHRSRVEPGDTCLRGSDPHVQPAIVGEEHQCGCHVASGVSLAEYGPVRVG
jgi:hypothetical protein